VQDFIGGLVDALRGLPPQAIVFIISALPVLELRGGVIAGINILQRPVAEVFVWAFLGNIASVTPLLLFLEPLEGVLRRNRATRFLLDWFFRRAEKRKASVERWGYLGLWLFVAIPAPVTGAWTGTAVALLLGLRRGPALAAIYAGVVTAGFIMTIVAQIIKAALGQ